MRTINGRAEALDPRRRPLVFWNTEALKGHGTFFSVSDQKLPNISFQFRGRERAPWWHGGKTLDRYTMTGDEQRELWYDEQGRLVRVKFQSGGADIEFLLQDASDCSTTIRSDRLDPIGPRSRHACRACFRFRRSRRRR